MNLTDLEYEAKKITYDVVTVGHLDSNKNQMLLIKACAFLPDFKLAIIGDGHKRLSLESESSKKNLNIVFFGNIPHKQVFKEMQRSRIYVHTSKSEGLPVTILEAMFVGLPIIIVDSPYGHVLKNYGFHFKIANVT